MGKEEVNTASPLAQRESFLLLSTSVPSRERSERVVNIFPSWIFPRGHLGCAFVVK